MEDELRPHREKYCRILRDSLAEHEMLSKDLAAAVGRSKSWMSQILNGRRSLRPDGAEQLARALRLPERTRRELLAQVELDRGASLLGLERARAVVESEGEPIGALVGARLAMNEWYVGAIYQLAGCEGFRHDPHWIAATLQPRITPAQAAQALEILSRLGVLTEEHRLENPSVTFGPETPSSGPKARKFHADLRALAVSALSDNRTTEQYFRSGFIALSEEEFPRFRERIAALAIEVFNAKPGDGDPTRVYALDIEMFPVSLYTDTEYDPTTL